MHAPELGRVHGVRIEEQDPLTGAVGPGEGRARLEMQAVAQLGLDDGIADRLSQRSQGGDALLVSPRGQADIQRLIDPHHIATVQISFSDVMHLKVPGEAAGGRACLSDP
jgi:hypothetical protein